MTTTQTILRSVKIGEVYTSSGFRRVATVVTDHGTFVTRPGGGMGSAFHEGMKDIPLEITTNNEYLIDARQ